MESPEYLALLQHLLTSEEGLPVILGIVGSAVAIWAASAGIRGGRPTPAPPEALPPACAAAGLAEMQERILNELRAMAGEQAEMEERQQSIRDLLVRIEDRTRPS